MRASAATFRRGTSLKATYVLLGCLDLALTLYAMGAGYRELNPFVAAFHDRPLELFMLKAAVPLVIAWLVPARFLVPSIALLAGVVGWNLGQLVLGVIG